MVARKLVSFLRSPRASSLSNPIEQETGKGRSLGRKAVSAALLCLTGGVALSAVSDLAIYQGCSSKAMEKVSQNQAIIDAIGEPVVKGPWYNASMAVAQKRKSVSCSFPVSGPQGNGILHLKAFRNKDESWLSFLRPQFEILILDALLHLPSNDEKHQTIKIKLADVISPSPAACVTCPRPQEPATPDKQ